jgi:acyl dehydratase
VWLAHANARTTVLVAYELLSGFVDVRFDSKCEELRLPIPVRPADELDLDVAILEKRESKSNSDRGIVRNQIHLRNQKREIVFQCINTVLVARRPAES